MSVGRKVFNPNESEELYLKAVNVVDTVDDYLRSTGAKTVADDPTNARYYLTAGYALRVSGIEKLSDFDLVPSTVLKSKPTVPQLTELHKLLYQEVAKLDDGKTALDRIFKGTNLKTAYYDQILKLNAK
jgi:hypothetical protein